MKKLVTIALCLLMVAALAVTVFANGNATFTASPVSDTVERGEEFTVTISCSNSTPAYSYGVKIEYDSDVFEIVKGSLDSDVLGLNPSVKTFNKTRGFAFMFPTENDDGEAQDPVAFNGKVGTVTFKVKDNAAFGTYTITGVSSIASPKVESTDATAAITVFCSHTYGSWTNANADAHSKICSKCGDVQTESHKWDSGNVTTAATCEGTGVKTYTCSTCKATKTETVAALGHKEGTGTQTKAPTCTEDGVKSFNCTKCQKVLRTEAVAALGHTEDSGTVTKEATCKEDGVRTFKCTACKEVLRTEVISKNDAHKFGNLLYVDENGHKDVCSICKQELTLPHTWDDGKVTQEETCKDTGIKTYTCTGCKGTKTEVIPVNDDHKYDSAEYVDENGHKAICSVCQNEVTVDHKWDDGEITLEPTCQDDGEKTYTCSECNGTKVEVIEASEEYHKVSEWTVTVQPTYESSGSREGVCTVCQETIVEELPAIAVPPTGDNSKIILWSTVLVLSACGLFATIFLLSDKKRKFDR